MEHHGTTRLLCASLMMAAAGASTAQTVFPNRAIRLVIPSSAGGGSDIVARFIAQETVKWANVARAAGIKPE